ncbi:MAG: hypothetical protein KAJ58_02335 [Candidatus Pacebacteria bacterium]|nr:hypothetical protein [Candidatus Paceibacterota bacterium]
MKKRREIEVLQKGRSFKVEGSFKFAVQIPDNAIGCSGSRCSNCDNKEVYCHQICKECGLPFVGPFGLPQLPIWESMSFSKRKALVLKIFKHKKNRGRMEYIGIRFIPMTPRELLRIETLDEKGAESFLCVHGVSPGNMKNILHA